MDNNRVKILWTVIILFALLSAFYMGRNSVKARVVEVDRVVYDTIVHEKVKVDTMWRTRVEKVYLTEVRRDTVTIRDTVLVEVPIYTYIASDSLYKVVVEGFGVEFKSVEVYPKTIYKERTDIIKERNRWGIGVQAGYGISKDKLTPYIGIGVSYNIITW